MMFAITQALAFLLLSLLVYYDRTALPDNDGLVRRFMYFDLRGLYNGRYAPAVQKLIKDKHSGLVIYDKTSGPRVVAPCVCDDCEENRHWMAIGEAEVKKALS